MKKFLKYIVTVPLFPYAAQVAYYFLLSLFPFIFLLTKFAALFSISSDTILNVIYYLFPAPTYNLIYSNLYTLTAYSNTVATGLYILLALWSSSMLINSLKTILSEPYERFSVTTNVIIRRSLSILLTILLMFIVVSAVFTSLFANVLFEIIAKRLNIAVVTRSLSFIFSFVIGIVVFVLIYMFIPEKPTKFADALPGTMFTTLCVSTSSSFFSYYVNHIADYSKLYGALGSIIMLVIWLYILSFIIIVGGQINIFYKKNKRKEELKK